MAIRTLSLAFARTCLCVAVLLTAACGGQFEERRADAAYQEALARNDPAAQRIALLALTRANEDNSENWLRLAKLELDIGDYGSAYQHFSRAHELDRTNVAPLSMMTELAVINGRIDLADIHMKELLVIAPEDRAVAVARGFSALRDGDFEQAQTNASILLAQSTVDPIANILQTRILVKQRKIPEAIALLESRLAAGSQDRVMFRSLGAIYRYLGEWRKAAAIDLKVWQLAPRDSTLAANAVSDALHAGNRDLAMRVTVRMLEQSTGREDIDRVLAPWVSLARSETALAAALPASAPEQTMMSLAHYLNQIGRSNQAIALLGGRPRPLGNRANLAFNAVYGEALAAQGKAGEALPILNSVLAGEGDDPIALVARARLLSAAGDHRRATIDAQRLTATYATIADYRVLLADVYRASGDGRAAERTLWDGYRDLPLADSLYKQVRQVLVSRGDPEGAARLAVEHEDEKYAQLMKDLA